MMYPNQDEIEEKVDILSLTNEFFHGLDDPHSTSYIDENGLNADTCHEVNARSEIEDSQTDWSPYEK